ncbi:MAG: hypothetical protein WCD37_07555 [Chloroflexia bacterium]
MATRFAKKPDPAIKKNVLRARAAARNAKTAHASVVVSSLLTTLFAWALFSSQDAQLTEATNTATSNQAAITAPSQGANTQAEAEQPPTRLEISR